MKKTFLTLSIILSSFFLTAQDSFEDQTINLHLDRVEWQPKSKLKTRTHRVNVSLGIGLMTGGAAFIVAGVLTPLTYTGSHTHIKNPFYRQPRFYPVLTGIICMASGVTISLF